MLLKSSLANQEAVQAKTAGKKQSEWARGRKKKTAVCVVCIPPLSRSLSICVLQSWGAFECVCVCVYMWQSLQEDRVKVCLEGCVRLLTYSF